MNPLILKNQPAFITDPWEIFSLCMDFTVLIIAGLVCVYYAANMYQSPFNIYLILFLGVVLVRVIVCIIETCVIETCVIKTCIIETCVTDLLSCDVLTFIHHLDYYSHENFIHLLTLAIIVGFFIMNLRKRKPIKKTYPYDGVRYPEMTTCGICHEEYQDGNALVVLPCGHDFHAIADCDVARISFESVSRPDHFYLNLLTRCPICSKPVS